MNIDDPEVIAKENAAIEEILEKEDEESFDYYTDHFTSNIQSRDPLSAISELEDSLYHASKSAGLLAGKPKWIVMWSILLAYGLWRIQEDEEVVFRLKYAKFMLDKYEEEIGSKAVAYLRAKMIALSRFPSVPFVEGVSTDEPKFEWNPDSVWAQTESNENAQERSAEVEVQAGGGADGSGMEVSAVDNLCDATEEAAGNLSVQHLRLEDDAQYRQPLSSSDTQAG